MLMANVLCNISMQDDYGRVWYIYLEEKVEYIKRNGRQDMDE
jgi:hypothetical protein